MYVLQFMSMLDSQVNVRQSKFRLATVCYIWNLAKKLECIDNIWCVQIGLRVESHAHTCTHARTHAGTHVFKTHTYTGTHT